MELKSFDYYYTTMLPGYVTQLYRDIDLVNYDAEYVKKYDSYDKNDTIKLNKQRVSNIIQAVDWNGIDVILDVGCGNGLFLEEMYKRDQPVLYGYDVVDVELPDYVKKIKSEEEIFTKKYDIVTFFDSLEHIPVNDIRKYLKKFDTEYFVISVPWFHYHNTSDWFMKWKHRRPNEHLHHFDSFGLIRVLNDVGYDCISINNNEDVIRKSDNGQPNILTVVARRKK